MEKSEFGSPKPIWLLATLLCVGLLGCKYEINADLPLSSISATEERRDVNSASITLVIDAVAQEDCEAKKSQIARTLEEAIGTIEELNCAEKSRVTLHRWVLVDQVSRSGNSKTLRLVSERWEPKTLAIYLEWSAGAADALARRLEETSGRSSLFRSTVSLERVRIRITNDTKQAWRIVAPSAFVNGDPTPFPDFVLANGAAIDLALSDISSNSFDQLGLTLLFLLVSDDTTGQSFVEPTERERLAFANTPVGKAQRTLRKLGYYNGEISGL